MQFLHSNLIHTSKFIASSSFVYMKKLPIIREFFAFRPIFLQEFLC
nr:MAG TPA: hypothetical protein [Caudoviricetes sp.]